MRTLATEDSVRDWGVGVMEYFIKAWQAVNPFWVGTVSVINYVLFPDEAYVPAVIALMIVMGLDVVTKYYAISVQNGGFKQAFKDRKISSSSFWRGTARKLISYLVIMILAGLSVRVTLLTDVAVFMSTVAYSVMFLREAQSVLENLVDAGHDDVKWLIFWITRKKKDMLKTHGVEETDCAKGTEARQPKEAVVDVLNDKRV